MATRDPPPTSLWLAVGPLLADVAARLHADRIRRRQHFAGRPGARASPSSRLPPLAVVPEASWRGAARNEKSGTRHEPAEAQIAS